MNPAWVKLRLTQAGYLYHYAEVFLTGIMLKIESPKFIPNQVYTFLSENHYRTKVNHSINSPLSFSWIYRDLTKTSLKDGHV